MMIRKEVVDDHDGVRAVIADAFSEMGGPSEGGGEEIAIVDRLRDAGDLSLSLVTELGGKIVGHVAFSPVGVCVGKDVADRLLARGGESSDGDDDVLGSEMMNLPLNKREMLKLSGLYDADSEGTHLQSEQGAEVLLPGVGMCLGPLGVRRDLQRQGLGMALMMEGLRICKEKGVGFVTVLGDPNYYQRVGFEAASNWQLDGEFGGGVSDQEHAGALQVIELVEGYFERLLQGRGGLIRYADGFRGS
ncbi:GNAT family N-acetyltransferase [Poriferisphaera sp. WC338]|uniref:GNAT family N-acetyltransferase n=1 Tax=Poriferisphaera sp. WC338 TaxID=3425129 RepID=UPI003D815297